MVNDKNKENFILEFKSAYQYLYSSEKRRTHKILVNYDKDNKRWVVHDNDYNNRDKYFITKLKAIAYTEKYIRNVYVYAEKLKKVV